MKRLFLFESYVERLLEATRSEPHFSEREDERLVEVDRLKYDPEVRKAFMDAGISEDEAQKVLLEMIKKEVKDAIKAMLLVDFPPAKSYILPVKKFMFDVNGKQYPLNIVAYSVNKAGIKKQNFGNQYWIPCYRNKFYTLFLHPSDKTKEQIAEISSDHIKRAFGIDQDSVVAPETDFVTTFEVKDGKIVKKTEEKGSANKGVDFAGQWNLAPGRKFKFFMPAKKEYVEAEIVKVDNPTSYKSDKFFRVEVMVNLGANKAKMLKKILPEDKLLIPVKTESGMVDVPVTVHDSLYIVDKRADSPILKIK
jgi:hypothetical protein